jgi:hypothetical protein
MTRLFLQCRKLMNARGKADPAAAGSAVRNICNGEPMSTMKESGFEGPLPSSIIPDGFRCYRRGGCDREALCEGEGECLGIDPPLANALNRNRLDEINEPALPAGERDCGAGKKFQPIDTAPKDRPILAFMLGRWRIARWKLNHPHKWPKPFWSADDLRVTVSRAHQPKWWVELPPPPPEAGAMKNVVVALSEHTGTKR